MAVASRLRAVVGGFPPGPIRLISACAGQGRDVAMALAGHPRAPDVTGLLVELDPANASVAAGLLRDAGLSGLAVRVADAGRSDAYVGADPADVLLLCGIFGNIPDADIKNTIECALMLCAPGAFVLWTRHRRPPDRTPDIRSWFTAAGFSEVAFESGGPGSYGLGVVRLEVEPAIVPEVEPAPFQAGLRLFTFST